MSTEYDDFLRGKDRTFVGVGHDCEPADTRDSLFPFQREIVAWAVRKGRCAVWADTGLGKTVIEVEWLDRMVGPDEHGLILAPLAVAHQTIREAERILGVEVTYVRNATEASRHRLSICNYDRLDALDPSAFVAVVLDESSILKAFSGSTKRALVEKFKHTPYRMSASATPAPNDIEELCNHADFLGVMSPQEMRSTFFIADSRGQFMRYRLKGHAESAFYGWLASWAIACRYPSDLGYDDAGYRLPGLNIAAHYILSGLQARRSTLPRATEWHHGAVHRPQGNHRGSSRPRGRARRRGTGRILAGVVRTQRRIDRAGQGYPRGSRGRWGRPPRCQGRRTRGLRRRCHSSAGHEAEHRRHGDELPEVRTDGLRRAQRFLRAVLPSDPPLLPVRADQTRRRSHRPGRCGGVHLRQRPRQGADRQGHQFGTHRRRRRTQPRGTVQRHQQGRLIRTDTGASS